MNPLSRLGAAFLREHPDAAARALEDFPPESVARFLAAANTGTATKVVPYFTPAFAAAYLLASEPAAAGALFGQLLPDFQITVLRQLDRDRRDRLLGTLPVDQALTLRRLLPYPEGTAGAMMEAALASMPDELTVRQALKRIKRMRRGMRFYIYLTNHQGQLNGVTTLHELLSARPSGPVSQVAHKRVVSLQAGEAQRSVVNNPYWQDYHALPVVDENRVLLGVIRHKRIRRLQEQAHHTDTVSGGLNALVSVGELFSLSAGHLISALICAGTPRRHDRD